MVVNIRFVLAVPSLGTAHSVRTSGRRTSIERRANGVLGENSYSRLDE